MSEIHVLLGDVARIDAGIVDPTMEQYRRLPHISAEHITSVTGELRGIKTAEDDGMESGKYLFQSGNVLYSKLRPYLRKAAIPEFDGLCSADMYPIKTDSTRLRPGYLRLMLVSDRFTAFANEASARSRMPKLNREQLFSYPCVLPSVERQKDVEIAVQQQLAAVEDARQAAAAQLRELTQLANALIRETLAHPDTESHSLGDVLLEVKQGIGSRWADFPVLGATREGLAPAKEPVGKNPERYKPVTVGTVFYNPMRILIGSIAMVDEDDAPGITSPDYVALRGREGLVDSRWFYYWLRSPDGERCIASLARGAVRERMLFNRLAEGEIALPPYAVQQAGSRALAELRPMKASIEARLREIERLPQRLLAQVFDFEEEAEDA